MISGKDVSVKDCLNDWTKALDNENSTDNFMIYLKPSTEFLNEDSVIYYKIRIVKDFSEKRVSRGSLQGSVLDPLLFLVV